MKKAHGFLFIDTFALQLSAFFHTFEKDKIKEPILSKVCFTMKSQFFKTLLCSVVALLAGFTTAYGKSDHHVIDNPWINFSNGSILDITKVEMSDSCTVLTINAYYRPKWWIRIAIGSYLEADGEKYTMRGTEGIEPDT